MRIRSTLCLLEKALLTCIALSTTLPAAGLPSVSSGTLQLRLKADAGVTADANGLVSQWADQSPHANHASQPDVVKQPVLVKNAVPVSGKPVLRFDGVPSGAEGDYVQGSGQVDVPAGCTWFLFYKRSNQDPVREQIPFGVGIPGQLNANRFSYIRSGFGGGDSEMAFASWVGNDLGTGFSIPVDTYRIWVTRLSDEGTQVDLIDSDGETDTPFTMTLGGLQPPQAGYYVGGLGSEMRNFNGDIAELIVYRGALSNGDVKAVSDHLKAKYYRPGVAPYVSSTQPKGNTVRTNAVITIQITDGASQLAPASILFQLNGEAVSPTINKPAESRVTTITYDPEGALKEEALNTVRVVFGDTSTPAIVQTNEFSFVVINQWFRGAAPAADNRLLGAVPFSFIYDGKPSAQLLGRWKRSATQEPSASGRERYTMTWVDEQTGLEVMCEATVFQDFPAVEWLLRFRNTADKDTPILQDIRPLDLKVGVGEKETVIFHHAKGSTGAADDYATIDAVLAPGQKVSLPGEGLVSQTSLPYFNLEWPGGGMVGAIGWTGQWALSAQRNAGRELALQAGQQLTRLKLLPGESIRTPRILLVHWQGKDRLRGHNLLRRLLIAHYVPRINGQVVTPPLALTTFFAFNTGNGCTEQNQIEEIAKTPSMGLEAFWLDAGWYEGGWPSGVGNWFARKDNFPNGLRPLADAAHARGLKFIVWFEPERVSPNTRIGREHPQWLLGSPNYDRLFNLGIAEARQWMTHLLSQRISEWGIDVYRQDHNIPGLLYWRAADAPDRQGITEIRHLEGLYAMWDELLKRHPGLVIDNANWRGTGPDLEVLMRSAGSWTCSECGGCGADAVANQFHMIGLSLYVPLHANGPYAADPYTIRSVACFGAVMQFNTRAPDFKPDLMKRASEEVKSLRPYYLGDFYPLLEVDLNQKHWCGWQFDRPDLGEGFALFFRRSASPYLACEAPLKAIDPDAHYQVTFAETYDIKEQRRLTGRELARLRIEIGQAPGSLLVRYVKTGD